jgi:hypothetical protein
MKDDITRRGASRTYFKSKRKKTGRKTENVGVYSCVERILSAVYT